MPVYSLGYCGRVDTGLTGNTKLDRCLRKHKARRKRKGKR